VPTRRRGMGWRSGGGCAARSVRTAVLALPVGLMYGVAASSEESRDRAAGMSKRASIPCIEAGAPICRGPTVSYSPAGGVGFIRRGSVAREGSRGGRESVRAEPAEQGPRAGGPGGRARTERAPARRAKQSWPMGHPGAADERADSLQDQGRIEGGGRTSGRRVQIGVRRSARIPSTESRASGCR